MNNPSATQIPSSKFAPIIEATKDSIIIANDKYEIVHWNSASIKVFGFSKEEAIGRSINIFTPKDKQDDYRRDLKKYLLQEKDNEQARTTEIILQRKDGSTFPVEISISSWIEDKTTYIFGIIRDISDRKRIEKDNIDLRQIINKTPSCLKMVNRKGELIDMNTVGLKMIGAESLEPLLMKCIYDFIHEDHRERYKKFNEFICDGGEGSLIFKMNIMNGSVKYLETFARPHQLQNGEMGHLAITRDISERINSEKELFEKNQELEEAKRLSVVGEFAAGIAHEVNNPLAIIHSRCQLLELQIANLNIESEEVKNSIQESLNNMKETVELTSDLIKNLKTFSGKIDVDNMTVITLGEAVNMALKLIKKRCDNDGIQLLVNIDPNVKFVCSAAGLAQVLLNLIMNSIDAIKERNEKWIRISSSVSEKNVKVTITDSGNGIPHDIVHKITQPFFTTKEPGEGTGLGLSISLKLIHKMRGNLTYNPNIKNTQFVISFNSAVP